jgi:hypothetical protein
MLLKLDRQLWGLPYALGAIRKHDINIYSSQKYTFYMSINHLKHAIMLKQTLVYDLKKGERKSKVYINIKAKVDSSGTTSPKSYANCVILHSKIYSIENSEVRYIYSQIHILKCLLQVQGGQPL